jgi:hypothetical protein
MEAVKGSARSFILAGCLFGLIFHPEDGGSKNGLHAALFLLVVCLA